MASIAVKEESEIDIDAEAQNNGEAFLMNFDDQIEVSEDLKVQNSSQIIKKELQEEDNDLKIEIVDNLAAKIKNETDSRIDSRINQKVKQEEIDLTSDDEIQTLSNQPREYVHPEKKCCVCPYVGSIGNFSFPIDPEILRKWIEQTKISITDLKKDPRVCYKHFEKGQYRITSRKKTNHSLLLRNAIPTLNLPIKSSKENPNNNFSDDTDPLSINESENSSQSRDKEIDIDTSKKVKCCVKFCPSFGNVLTFSFPKPKKLRQKWIELTQISKNDLKSKDPQVCFEHFTKADYFQSFYRGTKKMLLLQNAIPTWNLPPKPKTKNEDIELETSTSKIDLQFGSYIENSTTQTQGKVLANKSGSNQTISAIQTSNEDPLKICDDLEIGNSSPISVESSQRTFNRDEKTEIEKIAMNREEFKYKCCVKFCHAVGNDGFFRFTKSRQRRQQWKELTQMSEECLGTGYDSRICFRHFKEGEYYTSFANGVKQTRLLRSAIPSLNLPPKASEQNLQDMIDMKESYSKIDLEVEMKEEAFKMDVNDPLKMSDNSEIGTLTPRIRLSDPLDIGEDSEIKNSSKIKEAPQQQSCKEEWFGGRRKFKCCVKFCPSFSYVDHFNFPKEPKLRQKWKELTQISEKDYSKKNPPPIVCLKHFKMEQYYRHSKTGQLQLKKIKTLNPIPTLNLPPRPLKGNPKVDQGEESYQSNSQKHKCCVKFCQSYSNLGMFDFPKDAMLREKWKELTQISEKDYSKKQPKVCLKHFKKEEYFATNTIITNYNNVKTRPYKLYRKLDTIPSLNLPPKPRNPESIIDLEINSTAQDLGVNISDEEIHNSDIGSLKEDLDVANSKSNSLTIKLEYSLDDCFEKLPSEDLKLNHQENDNQQIEDPLELSAEYLGGYFTL